MSNAQVKTSSFRIGQVAKEAGVNIQTIRYYERVSLLKPLRREQSGYRVYDPESAKRVQFIKKAQALGFSLDEIRSLLQLRGKTSRSKEVVRSKALQKVSEIRSKIQELQKLETTLKELIRDCKHGDVSGSCPILEKMEGGL